MVKTATIQDVARMAGVSTATVSRALSKPAVVSAAARQAVEEAICLTGYTMNHTARNLRQQRVGGILALVPNLANPFFSQILAGVARVLRPEGLNLLIADTETAPEDGLLAYANRSRADGLIVFDGGVPPEALAGPGRPPVVLACEWIEGFAAPRVLVDNMQGGRLAVGHLAGLGHADIGHLLGPRGNVLAKARLQGFQLALAERDLSFREDWCFDGDFSLDSGRMAARVFLDLVARPTAVFCASDEMACGFIGEVQRHGLTVPADVSVVGFDNIELIAHITPALTTIRQPRRRIGETAAQMLLDLIGGQQAPADRVLPVELVVRESTEHPRE